MLLQGVEKSYEQGEYLLDDVAKITDPDTGEPRATAVDDFEAEIGAGRIRFSRKTDAFDAAGKVIDSARKFGEALSGKGGQKSARQAFDDLSAEQQDFLGKIGAGRKGAGDVLGRDT